MTYLSYSADIEQVSPDEQRTVDGIIAGMIQQSETVESREHHAVRASHAKSSACATGTLSILDNLPSELSQGLFATPGTYPVAIRFAQGPGETLGDRVSTHRGMAIKVFDVPGDKLPGHSTDVQDFVLATGTTFPSGTAAGFLRDGSVIGKSAGMPEAAKSATSAMARTMSHLLHVVGAESAMADFFGHPFAHPLAEPYFSQAPIRYGEYVAKLGAFPATDAQAALRDWRLDPEADQDGFRHAAVDFFAKNAVAFELRVQLWTDARTQPIEDASVEWSADESPYRVAARIVLPVQDAYSPARRRYFDEQLTFSPAHSLAVHRPLGSVMRARRQVYRALSDFRHAKNGVPAVNPSSIKEIPA